MLTLNFNLRFAKHLIAHSNILMSIRAILKADFFYAQKQAFATSLQTLFHRVANVRTVLLISYAFYLSFSLDFNPI